MDSQYFLKVQGYFFRLFGFELSEKSLVLKRPAVNLLTMGPLSIMIWSIWIFAFHNVKDVDKLTQNMVAFITETWCIFKFGGFLYKRKELAQIIVTLKQMLDRESQLNPIYADIIKTQNEQEQRYSKIIGWSILIAAISTNLLSPLKMLLQYLQTGDAEVELQFPAELPLDIHYLPNYLLFYILNFFAIVGVALSFICIDLLFAGITINFITLFRIAQQKLAHLDWVSMSSSPEKLHELFRMHQNILKLSEEFSKCYEPLICVQYFMSSLQICMTCFQMVYKLSDPQVLFFSLYFVNILLDVFIYSHYGEGLKTESGNFSVAIYNSPWYECSGSVARSLHIALVRGQRLCIMNGYFFEANMLTFSSIVRTALSYMTLLRSFS